MICWGDKTATTTTSAARHRAAGTGTIATGDREASTGSCGAPCDAGYTSGRHSRRTPDGPPDGIDSCNRPAQCHNRPCCTRHKAAVAKTSAVFLMVCHLSEFSRGDNVGGIRRLPDNSHPCRPRNLILMNTRSGGERQGNCPGRGARADRILIRIDEGSANC
jgi:hypothetical protein